MVEEKIFQVNAGDSHLRPRNKMHTFWNPSESPAKFIDIYIPGGHEDYMADLASYLKTMLAHKKQILHCLNKNMI